MHDTTGLALFLAIVFLYFFPFLNALVSRHKNKTAIFCANLFFGWTLIGWAGCLVWSMTK